jgi:hypothetical protein
MIIAVAVQDLVFLAAMLTRRDLPHHFESLLIGFRARAGIVNPAHPRHFRDQLFSKQSPRNRPDGTAEEVHLDQLVPHSIGNAFAAIADIDRPDATRHGINKLFAFGIPNAKPFAFNDNPRVDRLKRLMLRKMVPDVGAVGFDHTRKIIAIGRAVHCCPSLKAEILTARTGALDLSIVDTSHLVTSRDTASRKASLAPVPAARILGIRINLRQGRIAVRTSRQGSSPKWSTAPVRGTDAPCFPERVGLPQKATTKSRHVSRFFGVYYTAPTSKPESSRVL